MSGSLFSPTSPEPQPAPEAAPADNRPASQPDVMLPTTTPAESGLPADVLLTPEEQAQAGQPQPLAEGQPAPQQGQEPPAGQGQGNPADRAPPGYVPHEALQAARTELKAQRQQMQQMQQQMQAFFGAAAAAGLRLPGQPAPEHQAPLPDVQTDPVAHFQARAEMLERQLQAMQQQQGQMTEAQRQQAQQQQFVEAYRAQATQYAQSNPDFAPAYQAWFSGLVQEAQAAGLAPQEAMAWAQSQEMAVAQRAMQQEVNPAERILAMAKVRGWKPPAPQQQQAPQPGWQPPAADPHAAFSALERGAAASRSVGTNGVGGAPPQGLTAERLASMPWDEFQRATDGDAWERLMRGG